MLASVFIPNRYNAFAWLNILFLILLICLGKIAPYAVVFGYFLETIIIGLFNIVKMILASKKDDSGSSIWFLVPFFIFHYGMFVAVQSVFAFVIIGIGGQSFINEPFDLIDNYTKIVSLEGMEYILPLFVITQLLKLIFDFVLTNKNRVFTASEIMTKPYVRIFIQQFVVILAMFFIMFSESGVIAAVLLVLFRGVVDFFMAAIREHQVLLDRVVDKIYDGKTSKEKLRKQLLLFSE
ncbi:DUF6498-containing protein [Siansivirga zeaxanthinifaciens]|uniref:Uncharacterized protein n=1 Tax=Siansivirga zeaxanthinifaciens CC-SAMT-1 TaxID=1454006 RepID=A0A0C5WCC3_9FLAO|nr:DUF6498-containing protein [Siansivirga zeaxanthinifaciens]AJR04698.1 hypothetical protein AW14_00460 [Siansivirga zeaxanthinifaciens CC-SAMT-1]